MMTNVRIISKFKELRERRGISQGKLAKRLGVTDVTIYNWDQGNHGLDYFVRMYLLCCELECQPGDLFDLIEDHSSDNFKNNNNVPDKRKSDKNKRILDQEMIERIQSARQLENLRRELGTANEVENSVECKEEE